MKSKISLFNPGIAKNLLRRFWPLWSAYFAVIVYLLPVKLYNQIVYIRDWQIFNWQISVSFLSDFLLKCGVLMMWVSAVACILAVMAVFGFLYGTRSCGMIASLPVRRETVFFTCCLTGLLPLLLADVLALLIAVPVAAGHVELRYLLMCFGMMVMANVFFFGFGTFCAMLTGNLVVLPAVYAVLNFAVGAAEGGARYLLSRFVYGMTTQVHVLDWLSPALFLWENQWVHEEAGLYTVNSFYILIAYCAAGLLLMGAALLLYRKRRMETATDAVAVAALKPVFKYCMTFGAALVLAALIYNVLLNTGLLRNLTGAAEAAAVLGLMLAGAFLGYFAAEMLLKKTLRVFRGNWRGCFVSFGLIAAFVLCFELDLPGFERRLPDLEDVALVNCMVEGTVVYNGNNVEELMDVHRQIIGHKAENEGAEETVTVYITYYSRKNGSAYFIRQYQIARDEEAVNDPNSDIMRLQAILNNPEAFQGRLPESGETIEESGIYYACLYSRTDGSKCELTPEQAADFYNSCLLPEVKEGRAGQQWIVYNDEYYHTMTDIEFKLQLKELWRNEQGRMVPRIVYYGEFGLPLDAERCMAWIEENTELEPRSVERPET